MPKRTYLRLRVAAFFVALGLVGSLAFGGALWFAWSRSGGPVDGYMTAGLIGGFTLLGLTAWVGFLFDENMSRPIMGLARELRARAATDFSAEISEKSGRYLGQLAPAIREVDEALSEARRKRDEAIAERTARIERDKALLGTLIRDLSQAVLVISPERRVLLFNDAAQMLFGPVSLDRPLDRFILTAPLDHHLSQVDQTPSTRFLTSATVDGSLVSGTLSPFGSGDEHLGHVLVCEAAKDPIQSEAQSQKCVSTLIEEVRRPAMNLSAMLDVLDMSETATDRHADMQSRMRDELQTLTHAVLEATEQTTATPLKAWPREHISIQSLFDLAGQPDVFVSSDVQDATISCDAFFVSSLISILTDLISLDGARSEAVWTSAADLDHPGQVKCTLSWTGRAMGQSDLDRFLDQPLFDPYSAFSSREVLDAINADVWLGHHAALHLTLSREGSGPVPLPVAKAGPRQFFDFKRSPGTDKRLSDMSFVVFDTETTGLDPKHDEVVQIAGVRILRSQILVADEFDRLVNPGRKIPGVSTEIHGITDAMVADAPRFCDVSLEFHDYVDDAVLVAHNAAFDMAFLDRIAASDGPEFCPNVLCTARLSQALDPQINDHTLDAVAQRYGVEIEPDLRHTALGDAYATAHVFHKMLDMLEKRDITTLEAAMALQQTH